MFDSLSYNVHAYLYPKILCVYMYIAAYGIPLCMCYNNTIISPTMQLYYAYRVLLQHCMMGI